MPDHDASFASLESPIGRLWLAGTDAGLLAITRSPDPEPLFAELARRGRTAIADPDALAPALDQLAAYFEGRRRGFSLPLDLAGLPPFDAAAYRAAGAIPFGETASYGQVAAIAGSPRAARAVGGAMARCPLFPVVPCHRVIHADGSIGGWGPEPWVKRWMLEHERRAAG
jgi:methylated-DNA-[protein]-cysteine S-methyltransferase